MPLWLTPLELRALQFEQQPSFKARLDALEGKTFAAYVFGQLLNPTDTDRARYEADHANEKEQIRRARNAVERDIWLFVKSALLSRNLVSRGRGSPSSGVEPIDADLWAFLILDWERGVAEGEGFRFFGVQFAITEELLARAARAQPPTVPSDPIVSPPPEPAAAARRSPETHSGMAGRPSAQHLYLAELQRRCDAGETCPSLTGEAEALQTWLRTAHPKLNPGAVGTIKNNIRRDYRKLETRTN